MSAMFNNQHPMSMYVPGSQQLPHTLLDGAQPASRANELVVNAIADTTLYNENNEPSTMDKNDAMDMFKTPSHTANATAIENTPTFAAWASVLPGMILVSKNQNVKKFRALSDGSACPVLACAYGLGPSDEADYSFAGVARSQSVKTKGMAQTADEYFTATRGGLATILNTSGKPIFCGDLVCWTFKEANASGYKFPADMPRRVSIARVDPGCYNPNTIGKCMFYADAGQSFDLKIGDE